MKKILLMAAFAVATLSANAQVWVGGALGFNYEKIKDTDAKTTFTIAPTVGYNLDEKWAIGLELGLGFSNDGYGLILPEYNGVKTTAVNVAPFARYTFAKAGMVSFFVDGGFGLAYEKEEKTITNNVKVSEDGTVWHIGFRPGISLALSDNWSAVATMGYFGYQHAEDYNRFGLGVNGNALSFGLYYTF